ncbi:hypothetical protein QBC35DRAFT_525400 [Podospora australis]|uniref:Oxidoreductase n=1 Tax=Podospora australis TaxID=1536484 RepID=A0AAN6WQR4_9PEZI|nr:hypothetical protein QBC35DRAFT_525400 [Podospora australis]
MPNLHFDPAKDIPDLSGKVILVTGGTTGIGATTIIELARHNPSHLIFTGRNADSAKATIASATSAASSSGHETPKLTFLPCDLTDLSSVASACNSLLPTLSRLDVVVLNAGIMAIPAAVSKDGYEIQFATNHLGQAFLLRKSLPLLLSTAESSPSSDVRVLILTSVAADFTPSDGITFSALKSEQRSKLGGRWMRYGQSKLANLLYAKEIAKRFGPKGIKAVAVHPGVVETGLVTKMGLGDKLLIYLPNVGRMLTPEQGAWNTLWAIATERGKVEDGGFYTPVGKKGVLAEKWTKDGELGGRLWDWTEGELKRWLE